MKITKQQLIGMDACEEGLERFIKQTNNTEEAVLIPSLVGGCNTTCDLVWLAYKLFNKEKVQEFVSKCALINVELIKPYCKGNQYKIIANFLETGNNAEEARSAAIAAASSAMASVASTATIAAADAYHAARAAAVACASDVYVRDVYVSAAAVAVADISYEISPEKVNDLLKELFTK